MASATSSTPPHPKANHPSIAETSETTTVMVVEVGSLIAAIIAMGVINRVRGIVEDTDIKRPPYTTNYTLDNSALVQASTHRHRSRTQRLHFAVTLAWYSVLSTDTKHPPVKALLTPDPGGK